MIDARCGLCRAPVSREWFRNVALATTGATANQGASASASNTNVKEEPHWYYEGRNGWWKFDDRTNGFIEENRAAGEDKFDLLICGNMYVIDIAGKIQYRKDGTGRVRRIKQDVPSKVDAKGTAGLVAVKK